VTELAARLGLEPREVAVVDIGSNSVRLALYRLEGRAIWTVFNEKVLAGLGRDLPNTGRLSPEGVVMAMTALRRFAAVIEGVRPVQTFVVATAAVRDAEDGPAFCEQIAAQTGLIVRVLTGEEEARFSALGVLAGAPNATGIAADLGGASLELTRIGDGQAQKGVTLPLGPFTLAGPKGFDAAWAQRLIDERLSAVASDFAAQDLHAVGGAWRSLAQIQMQRSDHPLRIVHQYSITADDARDLADLVMRKSSADLAVMEGVSRRRVDALPYAALVMRGLVDRLGMTSVCFSAWGLREGVLFAHMDDATVAADPLLAGFTALGARQGVSPSLPGALEGWLAGVTKALPSAFGPQRDALLTTAACRLSDLGARLHPDHRVEMAFDQVLRAPVPGQSHAERAYLSSVINARYGGPTATPQPAVADRLLNPDQRRRARALGLAIRLASDLSGRSAQVLAGTRLEFANGRLSLTAQPDHADVLLGEQTRRRAKALAEALGGKLTLG
jgi:exopolyphosphatase/guanosine-5'-triphosphate,3'-diphosphate pyrophosphatase